MMYRIDQLEGLLACSYPQKVSHETQKKRLEDITALQELIRSEVTANDLQYRVKEERLQIFQTHTGEKIYIQYPGKESVEIGADRRALDFRPKIMTADGRVLRDLVFADMWGLVEELDHQQHQMLKLMACIFFQLGRMTLHEYAEKDYLCESLDANEQVTGTSVKRLSWYELRIPDEILSSLNFFAPRITIDEDTAVSLEAFLYFFELLLQNEDSKYYDKKHNLTSGRIPTSDSMLLLSSHLFGKTKLSVLLQRFVSGFGVAHCGVDEIEPATDGLVRIVDRKKDLRSYFHDRGISYTEGSYISVHGVKYRTILKTKAPKIAYLSTVTQQAHDDLTGAGWEVHTIEELVDDTKYATILAEYGAV